MSGLGLVYALTQEMDNKMINNQYSFSVCLVFSQKDFFKVEKFESWLSNQGFKTTVISNLLTGEKSWQQAIENMISNSIITVVFLTPSAVLDESVNYAISYALAHNLTIVPILLQTCTYPRALQEISYVDFREDHQQGYKILKKLLFYIVSSINKESGYDKNNDPRSKAALNVIFYKLTDGKVGSTYRGMKILLIEHYGRKSGKRRITPVYYLSDEKGYLVAASDRGADKHPDWYWNVISAEYIEIQVMSKIIRVSVKEAISDERTHHFQRFLNLEIDNFRRYQQRTTRIIPILILTPQINEDIKSLNLHKNI